MDLFDEKNLEKLNKDNAKFKDFSSGKLNIQVFSSADPATSYDSLLHVKYLFQRMLPKMPRDYILRQVFDENQRCMTLNERIEGKVNVFRIIGAILFRPCFERCLVEIVFLAVDSEYHVSGYGTFLFNCFKEICKLQYSAFFKLGSLFQSKNIIVTDLSIFDHLDSIDISQLEFQNSVSVENKYETHEEVKRLKVSDDATHHQHDNTDILANIQANDRYTNDKNLYLLTYADNSAIGFFKKQGFTLHPRSTQWAGYVKDYEGGTLMECKVHKMVNYLRKRELVKQARDIVFDKMRKVNDFHILRKSSEREEIKKQREAHAPDRTWAMRTKEEFLSDFLYFIVCSLQSHPSSWPFLEPVSEKDVPDYFEVIKHPMDLSLIMRKLKGGMYFTLKDFALDVCLMCNNCFSYNGPDTQYYKCAENIKKYFESLIKSYASAILHWGFDVVFGDFK
ncbi:uncharacterized protein VICG_00137 [Vittaforma corneae ATCC 50505]|uniref:histone acetyltransferase n=1 Tax=Vittaforma corneae (strain ATCC 50505) TaxID=993615 RepID=L2GR71_VITCO|nr:uncharacterized protein VICG_00137 [Vittaforma corneae ATCC 50505]ELA42822.1 hypothetical protein VICG_00137 [Vittaforma corneae ATCC 50505]